MQRRKRRGEVGLDDFLTLLLILLGGLLIGSYGGQCFGWAGFLLGIPVGLAVSFGVLYGVALVAACLEAWLWGGIPGSSRKEQGAEQDSPENSGKTLQRFQHVLHGVRFPFSTTIVGRGSGAGTGSERRL